MPREFWKGAITFGLVHIPIHLHPAADSRNELDLTMLDRRSMSPVGFQRINKKTGKEVPWGEVVKGYEYEKGKYVVLSDEDFRRANVEATQTIDIFGFVEIDQIPLTYFETPYFLTPGKRGEKGYVLLRETLKRTKKAGIAYVVLRTKQHVALLFPMDDMLVLNLLRYPDEIRSIRDFDLPAAGSKAAGVDPKEVAIAERLVKSMSDDWDPSKYRDTYRDDLFALIEKKIKEGKTEEISLSEEPRAELPERGKVVDLMALLKRSIEERDRRSADQKSARSPSGKKPAVPKVAHPYRHRKSA
jgi:DNA end-binding protein Ku